MKTQKSVAAGYLLALAATILWSTFFPLVKIFPPNINPIELSFWRWLFTGIGLLPFVLKALKSHWKLIIIHWRWLAPAGILGFSGYSILIFEAGHTSNATNMSLFAATAPISMAILSKIFFKESLSRSQIIGLLIAILGVFVVVLRGNFFKLAQLNFTIGDIWVLIAASLFAVYSILIRNRPNKMPQKICMAAMLGFALTALLIGMFPIITTPHYQLPSIPVLLAICYAAIVPTLIGYMLWNKSVEYIGAARAGIVYYSIPLFSCFEAVFFLNESIHFSQVIGGFLIIGGILLSSLSALLGKQKTSS